MVLIRAVASQLNLTEEQIAELVGTIPMKRALAFQREYPAAFFDRHLRGRPSGLLKAPSPRFPEITYTR